MRAARSLVLSSLLLALAGCTTFSADGGMDTVKRLSGQSAASPAVGTLLAKPLGPDDAVAIALLNNRGLRARYAALGIVEADLVQAGRLPNPSFTFSRLRGADGVDIERKLMLPLVGLLTMPLARDAGQRRFEAAQLGAAADALGVADATRRAWIAAVAARQSTQYMEQVKEAAEASAELARRMQAAGNWSKLQQAREQAFLGDAIAQLARARLAESRETEMLVRLLGLPGPSFQLPERLPDLPAAPRQDKDAEATALANRLDLQMAQKELAGLSASLGLTRTTRFINLFDVGYRRDSAGHGPELELQIPLFDWGDARVARAQASYMEAVHRSAATANDARSQVRERLAAYHSHYALARHFRDEVVPLKKRISDEQLLRYNGNLISVFELLADAREQVQSVNAAIEALREFWLADAALQAAMTGATQNKE
ncbi:MAG: TolC family protein [Pseudomonadota bacterium]